MTGENKDIGSLIIKSVRIAVKEIGSDILEIYPKDSGSDPNKALTSAIELDRLGVNVVVGPVFHKSISYLDEIEKTIQNISTDQQEIEAILSGVDVNKEGEIERGTQFKGTKPALSYSDLGLLNLLSISEENSKGYEIRNAISKMDLTVQEIPIIKGFDALEHLTISIINENELKTN